MSNNTDPSTTKTAGTNAEQKPIVPNNAPNGHPTVKSSLIAEVMFTLLILFLGVQLMYLYYKHTAPFGPRQSELESVDRVRRTTQTQETGMSKCQRGEALQDPCSGRHHHSKQKCRNSG